MAPKTQNDICLFLPSLHVGGAERAFVTLANAFVVRGFAVDMVLAEAKGCFLEDLSPDVRVVDLGAGRVFRAALPLARYLRSVRPRALLSAMGHANVVALVARILSGSAARVVVSERSTFSMAWQGMQGRGNPAISILMPWLVRLLYPYADAVVSVSRGVEQDRVANVSVAPDRSVVIYNPVVDPTFMLRTDESLNMAWFNEGEPPVLLAVGRLTRAKNYPLLLNAFAHIRARRPCRLVILGEGEQRESLLSLAQLLGIADDLHMPGFVDNPLPWMRQAAVFVLSSSWEGLPGVLIQAMACGARVVSTDCPNGPAEILEQGRWGRLVPVDDMAALASTIEGVLDSPSAPDARLRAMDFGLEHAVNAYLAALALPLRVEAA